jgi:hypothetical protein
VPQRPHESLNVGRRVWRSVRNRQPLDAHDLVQPTIEMGSGVIAPGFRA